jgi:hypothetical protein
MTNPTSNFGWQMPEPTDLVTNLPADFEVFGQAVDSDFADLLGGTTGQVLKKNTNADLDFVWGADSAGMTNPMTTTGDIIYSSPGSTPVRLGVGSAGNVLTVASGVPSWAAPTGGGKLLQLVQGSYSTATTITTTTMTDTGLSLSITPTSATSKILVMINQLYKFDIAGNEQGHSMRILRGATEVYATGSSQTAGYLYGNTLTSLGSGAITPLCYLDSPATTSSTTYKTQGRLQTASGSCIYQINSGTSIITLMEIGA